MNDLAIRAEPLAILIGKDQPVYAPQRVILDSRFPRLLDHRGYVLQVLAGRIDIFAVGLTDKKAEGARHHLFRVEIDEIVLDLSEPGDQGRERLQVMAVGSPGTEALLLPHQGIRDFGRVAMWIGRLGALIAAQRVPWTVREAETGRKCDIKPGERRGASSQGIVWVSVDSGSIRLMGLEPAYLSTSPPVPLTAGMWIEAGEQGSSVVFSNHSPSCDENLWLALHQFHLCAMADIRQKLAADANREAQLLLGRIQIGRSQAAKAFEDLSAVIVRPSATGPPGIETEDPLLSACHIVGNDMGIAIVRPSEREPVRRQFDDVVEIGRASRFRVRRTLLRANWWKRDAGPLLAWYGEERTPVALIPNARHRYLMIEPKSGVSRAVTEAVAAALTPEAAMFYPSLPSRALALRDLLTFSMRYAQGNVVRITFGALLLGLLSLVAPLITHELVDSVIPRTEFDQLAFCAAALAVTAVSIACVEMMQEVAILRLEGVLDWKLQAAVVDRLLRLPASFFRQYTVGDLVARSLGIDAIRRGFHRAHPPRPVGGPVLLVQLSPDVLLRFQARTDCYRAYDHKSSIHYRRQCSTSPSRKPALQFAG